MPERGGPTTQSGISYQNLIATQYVSELLSGEALPDADRITAVRTEAPVIVDDIVVIFGDGHRFYIQAKETLQLSGEPWRKVWSDFVAQFRRADFQSNIDEIHLVVGGNKEDLVTLAEAFERITGAQSFDEWWDALTNDAQRLWRDKIGPLLTLGDAERWEFLRCVRIQVHLRRIVEKESIRLLPAAYNEENLPIQSTTLWDLLKARVPDAARFRQELSLPVLTQWFSERHQIRFVSPPPLSQLQQAISRCSAVLRSQRYVIGKQERHLSRAATEQIAAWLRSPMTAETDNIGVLLDGPGRGKTVVLRQVLTILEDEGTQVLAIKADRQLGDLDDGRPIHECAGVQLPAPVEDVVAWLSRARTGGESAPVVVLLDQVDALSQSMARDARALEAIVTLVSHLRSLPQVRVLLACRTFDLHSTPALQSLDIKQRFSLPDLTDDEITAVLNDTGIQAHHIALATRQLLRVPLHLDIFVRAIEGDDAEKILAPRQGDVRELGSLQDLYALLWSRAVAGPQAQNAAPIPVPDRVAVLRRLVKHMADTQKTIAPQSLFHSTNDENLCTAANFLASTGILQLGLHGWSFLHQTFFDYCFARFFVEDSRCLADEVFESPQGLAERPLLKNVLSYLRATDETAYCREMGHLGITKFFDNVGLRVHLRELLRSWFGALRKPTHIEWRWVRSWLLNDKKRDLFLHAASGNTDWFELLQAEHLPRWLQQLQANPPDTTLENQIFYFLCTLHDDPQAQSIIVAMLRPYLNRNELWNKRLTHWVSYIRHWHSVEAVELYEELLLTQWDGDTLFHYQLAEISKQHPISGCRILDRVLAFTLDRMCATVQDSEISFFSNPFREFDDRSSGGLRLNDDVLKTLAGREPSTFLVAIWGFFKAVLPMGRRYYDSEQSYYFPSDAFRDIWEIRTSNGLIMRHHFGFALADAMRQALKTLAIEKADIFAVWEQRLSVLPFQTPQRMLLDTYCDAGERYATPACEWLLADIRRLDLGEEGWETRRLIRSIVPHLDTRQVLQIEECILGFWPFRDFIARGIRDTWILKRNGIEQWRLLHAIGYDRLSEAGQRRLREWDDKFCDWRLSERPITSGVGFIGSPIDLDKGRKMSDAAWLKAMAHYREGVRHKDSMTLRGGAEQLAPYVLQPIVTEQPERFARLALETVPLDVDGFYVKALVAGLAASVLPGERFFAVVRRFTAHKGPDVYHDVAQSLARALRDRAADRVPDDLLKWLKDIVAGDPPASQSERFYTDQQSTKDPASVGQDGRAAHYDPLNGGPILDYLNSTRGVAYSALMAALRERGDVGLQWNWVERITEEPSDALRAGAVQEMISIESWNHERAWQLFCRLLDDHPEVLRSHFTHRVLYWAVYHFPTEAEPFVRALMDDSFSNLAEEGAKIACVLALREDDAISDEVLWNKLQHGPVSWRRGIAEVLANTVTHNLSQSKRDICCAVLFELFSDEDDEVRHAAARWTHDLNEEHLQTLSPFFEAFLTSPAYDKGMYWCHEFLWKYGELRPSWTLDRIEAILRRAEGAECSHYRMGDELVRSVLRIYTLPDADTTLQTRAIEVFGQLMVKFPHDASKALNEWDEGRYI